MGKSIVKPWRRMPPERRNRRRVHALPGQYTGQGRFPGGVATESAAVPWVSTPLTTPKHPVNSAARAGMQGVLEAYAREKRTPSAASASMCGVGRPYPQQDKWSGRSVSISK